MDWGTMREEINICEQIGKPGVVNVIDVKTLTTRLDEANMEVLASYCGEEYPVLGSFLFPYIIIR